ncbi:MAG: rhodanese [Proteobacteria bacterium]|nr:rhodanese [Pseudomonadota bacterium]NDC24612.1 rhodanese [Pseudomonadota bacterium]NDD04529.1 rhodanese [Pseudomonadota bacterium]NDG27214.1 rhodanese [Pseudomonadota bacterium]
MSEFDIAPLDLKMRIDDDEDVFILDVREPEEWRLANIGGTLIPLGELSQRFSELDPDREVFVLCHHGVRSSRACMFLRQNGFKKIKNIRGGIEQWSLEADPSIPRY